MSRWWRAYDEAVDDPKLIVLTDEQHRFWFNILCVYSAFGGRLPDVRTLSIKLRMQPRRVIRLLNDLRSAQLLEDANGLVIPHNWDLRQYKSDVSTDRVKRFRQQHRNVSCNVSETVSETTRSVSVSSSLKSSLELKEVEEEQACGKFDQFWAVYPHKVGKKDAEKKFHQALKIVSFERLMAALAAYRSKTDDRPWCNPATWLNQGRWDDEPAQVQAHATDRDAVKAGFRQALDKLGDYIENAPTDGDFGQTPLRLVPGTGRG